MKICVIGTGYVGLVTGVCLSDLGNEVVCVDTDPEKIDKLNQKINPIFEPGLDGLLSKNIKSGRLTFSLSTKESAPHTEIIYICVGTPPKANGEADISYVIQAAKDIGQGIKDRCNQYFVIVNKSTVPVGMGNIVKNTLLEAGVKADCFGVVSNPEFLREGSAVNDMQNPDRIVIGGTNEKALEIMEQLYKPMFRVKCPIIKTNLETAELIKYASNAFLATKISFINEIANICDRVGADVNMVAKGMGTDGRIGKYFLHPGPGYGGSCFPKDTQALVQIADRAGYNLKIVKAVTEVNESQKIVAISMLKTVLNHELSNRTIALLGLAFKPNTDDMRDAPSLAIIEALLKENCQIQVFDPVSMGNAKTVLHDTVLFTSDAYSCVKNADAAIVVTEWNDFRLLDLKRIKNNLKQPNIVDTRNIYDPTEMIELGFQYISLGRACLSNVARLESVVFS